METTLSRIFTVNRFQVYFVLINIILLFGVDYSVDAVTTPDSTLYLRNNGERPWFIQYIYADVLGGSTAHIVILQKVFHIISAAFITFTITKIVKSNSIKILSIIAVNCLFGWWNIVGWSHVLLSESLSFSFLMIACSSLILFLQKNRNYHWLALFCLSAILTSGVRDHFHYVFIVVVLVAVTHSLFYDRKKSLLLLITLPILVLQSLYINRTIAEHNRHSVVTTNLIQMRLMKIPKATNFLIENGMPYSDEIKKLVDKPGWSIDRTAMSKPSVKAYLDWIDNYGMQTYKKYLLSHPKYVLFYPFTNKEVYRIDAPTSYPGYPSNKVYFVLTTLQPIFNFRTCLILLFVGMFVGRKTKINLFPAILFFTLTIVDFYLSFHADTMEISRHLIRVSPLIQLSAICAIAIILDSRFFFLQTWKVKKDTRLTNQ